MGITTNDLYHIPPENFGLLFGDYNSSNDKTINENIDTINKTIATLKSQAISGDTESIDLLLNIALRKNNIGKLAEDVIWSIYNNEDTHARTGVDKDIEISCTNLYKTITKIKDYNKNPFDVIPPRILYIIGSNASEDLKTDIKNNIIAKEKSSFSSEHIWGNNRMLYDDEINMEMERFSDNNNNFVATPFPVYPEVENFALADHISKIEASNNNDSVSHNVSGYTNHLIPIILEEQSHFILINLKISHTNNKPYAEATVFNSYNPLPSKTKENIKKIINDNIKIDHANEIEIIEKNIQNNMPNSCGLHVIEAMKFIIEHAGMDPKACLSNYIEKISNFSPEDQQKYNAIKRREYLALAFRPRNDAVA